MTEAELDKLLQPYKDSNGNVKPKDVYRVILSCYTDKWQPIETAPKDESRVLIAGGLSRTVGSDEWFKDKEVRLAMKYPGDHHYTVNDYYDSKPTDWMPLPEPPKKARE